MIDLSAYKKSFHSLPPDVSAAEVNAERTSVVSVTVEKGRIASGESYTRTKYYVRTNGEHAGTAYTENPDDDAREMILRSSENGRHMTAGNQAPMNGKSNQQMINEIEPVDVAAMLDLGTAVEAAADKYTDMRITDLRVASRIHEMHTVNSLGMDAESRTQYSAVQIAVRLSRLKGVAEGRVQLSARHLAEIDAVTLLKKAYASANDRDGGGLPCKKLKSGMYDAVLSGDVMRNILMTAWQVFSGEAMEKGSCPFKGKGERAGSSVLNITNAPSHPLIGQCFCMDSEGTVIPRTAVVQKGIITNPLYTLSSARAAGSKSTGNAGRIPRMTGDVPIMLTTVPSVLYVEPGSVAKSMLLDKMKSGLLLTYSLDLYHSVNASTGEFSIPCGGVYYVDGKPEAAVSEITMAGNLRTLWERIEEVSSDLDFDDFYFKNYCIGSPSALIRKIMFAS